MGELCELNLKRACDGFACLVVRGICPQVFLGKIIRFPPKANKTLMADVRRHTNDGISLSVSYFQFVASLISCWLF